MRLDRGQNIDRAPGPCLSLPWHVTLSLTQLARFETSLVESHPRGAVTPRKTAHHINAGEPNTTESGTAIAKLD